jgi:hypothetical protein
LFVRLWFCVGSALVLDWVFEVFVTIYILLLFWFLQKHNFQTPIDEQDAASRVLDPVIAPLLALQRGEPVEPPWGHFLKDYQKCEW